MTYIAGAISHTALGGIGLALFLQVMLGTTMLTPFSGALLFALISSIIISVTLIRRSERLDTIIGAIWAVGMSIGLVFIYLTPTYVDPMSYLFGNILLISKSNLITILILNLVTIGTSLLLFPQFTAVSFDSEFAASRGLKTAFFEVILVMLMALTVVLLIKIIGIVMVIALLTIPPAIAGLYTKRMAAMILVSGVVCALIMTGGLAASYVLGIPTGSTTVLLGGFIFIAAKIIVIPGFRKRRSSRLVP
jgi:zinc transport system permease protein